MVQTSYPFPYRQFIVKSNYTKLKLTPEIALLYNFDLLKSLVPNNKLLSAGVFPVQ